MVIIELPFLLVASQGIMALILCLMIIAGFIMIAINLKSVK
jgi:hypothetical protein